jgi:hypothetical protein
MKNQQQKLENEKVILQIVMNQNNSDTEIEKIHLENILNEYK